MIEVTFRDKIYALRKAFTEDRYNVNRTNDFWYVMDSISDELVLKWSERASRIKNPMGEGWRVDEWEKLCNILHYMKTYDRMTQPKWSKASKRFCTFMIIKFWDDLENIYYCS